MNKSASTGGVIMDSNRGADGQLTAEDMKDDTVIEIKVKPTPKKMVLSSIVIIGLLYLVYTKKKK
jgi:hypothetical protein